VWVLPLSRYATGSLAVLVSLLEVGIWIEQLTRFDFGRSGLQFEQRTPWIKDLGVSYHVGEYAFSLWLVGLTVVAMAAAIGYGFWVGRDRSRAYFGLMLFLTGTIVGVFTSQDLLLFYAFFEGMLIPLYILLGVWGGAGRLGATVKLLIYTMAGSLLMLAALQRLFEHKFYVDELYDGIFYKPAVATSLISHRELEEPVLLAAGPDIGETAFDTGRGVRRLQTGLLRTYVFFLGTGMAVLAIVFLLTK
jgi:NADH:ubiquinone oxidoreductase subunit 4 (subunit M)